MSESRYLGAGDAGGVGLVAARVSGVLPAPCGLSGAGAEAAGRGGAFGAGCAGASPELREQPAIVRTAAASATRAGLRSVVSMASKRGRGAIGPLSAP